MITDITCRFIVMKDGRVYRGRAEFPDGSTQYRFSENLFDAKSFKTSEKAHAAARRIGGVVKLFDKLRGELI